ncbi:protein of unknown function DUF861 cupin 3 [Rhizobium sp. CF080]|uniref:cupin domain-containing protein n=1 Tax=Rhizobium sp. (strain CF080) TaxID=1144310 RepID=UPI00027192CB|nr:cupin domain-containing protein [Rhizobium sp. CF080]EUB99854.1 protein of unknown function DUF861 cupin 3 [Rhizobium sp. CF080]
MTDILSFHAPLTLDIGEFKVKPTSIDEGQTEASLQFWERSDGAISSGIWECTPGRFATTREATSETCFLLTGRVTIHSQDGRSYFFGPGDMFTLPLGWSGTWEVHETVRKVYFISAGDAGQ